MLVLPEHKQEHSWDTPAELVALAIQDRVPGTKIVSSLPSSSGKEGVLFLLNRSEPGVLIQSADKKQGKRILRALLARKVRAHLERGGGKDLTLLIGPVDANQVASAVVEAFSTSSFSTSHPRVADYFTSKAKVADQAASVVTGFCSMFVFDLLRTRYRDELGFIVVTALAFLWSQIQYLLTWMLIFLSDERDDPKWLKVWARLVSLVGLLLVFLFGQYIIVLLLEDITTNHTSQFLGVFFLLILVWALYSFAEDSSEEYTRSPWDDTDSTLIDAATTANISSKTFLINTPV